MKRYLGMIDFDRLCSLMRECITILIAPQVITRYHQNHHFNKRQLKPTLSDTKNGSQAVRCDDAT